MEVQRDGHIERDPDGSGEIEGVEDVHSHLAADASGVPTYYGWCLFGQVAATISKDGVCLSSVMKEHNGNKRAGHRNSRFAIV